MNDQVRAVVLVEGVSDQVALETIAERRGRDLAAEGIDVVPMGGARNIGRYLERYGPGGLGLELTGLCDAGEEGEIRLGLERAGLWVGQGRAGLHRFLGSGGGRKLRYARLLAGALDPLAVPRPLDRVLARLRPRPAGR